jgi:phage terminase large subunit-like protein
MPRKIKEKDLSANDLILQLQEKLQIQASRPNILGYAPHDKQIIFHNSTKKKRLYIGGNRSGKTTGGVVEDIHWLQGTHPTIRTPEPPIRGRVVGVDFNDGIDKIIIPEFQRWCPPSYLRGGSWYSAYDVQPRTLYFENGSFVEFMSYEQDVQKFAGTSRHFVHFDEEPPLDIYIECIARLVDTGGSWWMTLTPVLGMQWMYDDIYLPSISSSDSDIKTIEVSITDNPYIGRAEIDDFIKSLPEDDRTARVHGQFIRRGGVIYKKFDVGVHVIPPLTELPEGWDIYASVDHGFNNPTSWHWHLVSLDGEVITFMEHYEREMVIADHATQVKLIEQTFNGRVPVIRVCDPALAQRNPVTGTSVQAEYAVHGIELSPGVNDVMTGINKVNAYMDYNSERPPRWHVTANCDNLIREAPKYRWKTWSNQKSSRENNPYDVPHKKDDHAMDDLRYFFTVMPDLAPIDLSSIVKREPTEPLLPAVGIDLRQPVIDKNLSKPKYSVDSNGWFIINPDEYMGGEW